MELKTSENATSGGQTLSTYTILWLQLTGPVLGASLPPGKDKYPTWFTAKIISMIKIKKDTGIIIEKN